jgi:AcrR family transcriptional regulator
LTSSITPLFNSRVIEGLAVTGEGRRRKRAPAKRHRRITRGRVLDAAERLFIEKGYRGTSVAEIAAAAGYTTGAIYSSFSGKDELFIAVSQRRFEWQMAAWREALASVTSPEDAAPVLTAALKRTMPEPAWTGAYYEFISYALRDDRLRERVAAWHRASIEMFEEGLADVGSSSPLPIERVAPIVRALMHGAAARAFIDQEADYAALFHDGVAVLLGAVKRGR